MTDIVERLRTVDISWSQEGEWCAEAADEIIKLRKVLQENEQLRDALSEAIKFADQDYHALTPTGETMISRWRSALQQKDTEKLSQILIFELDVRQNTLADV